MFCFAKKENKIRHFVAFDTLVNTIFEAIGRSLCLYACLKTKFWPIHPFKMLHK